jgi:osmoprotectant transport system permease protein
MPLASFGGAIEFIFSPQESNVTGGKKVGGLDKSLELLVGHLEVTFLALAIALIVALPIGLYLGHTGKGELFAIGIGNAGRAIPELAVIALVATLIGIGMRNVAPALAVLGLAPILVNTYVGVRQVATATIAPLAGVETLGDFIINRNVYGENGLLAGAILVALLALTIEGLLALLQHRLTSDGLKLKTV